MGFSHFFPGKKCDDYARVECATRCALQPVHRACLWTDDHQFWTAPDNRVWKRIYDPHYDRLYWNIVGTAHVQWEAPWQGWGSSDSDA